MNINYTLLAGKSKEERLVSYIIFTLLMIALVGSILSAFGICSGGCTDIEKYRLFGLKFASIGIPFFVVATIVSLLRNSTKLGRYVFDFMIAGATGAEYLFFYIQKNVIGHYCPVCLVIAVVVVMATALRLGEVITSELTYTTFSRLKRYSRALAHVGIMASICFSGLTIAIAGTSNPFSASVSNRSVRLNPNIWFSGPPIPKVEVYFVTDWFCDYCKKAEPTMAAMLPVIGKEARYTFIDKPLHMQSLNFVPFHASLLHNDKTNYIQGRNILQDLADKKQTPTEESIKAAFAQRGLKFQMADYTIVSEHSISVVAFLRNASVTMTPSIVVRNIITNEQQVLAGIENIKEQIVLDTIKKLQSSGR